MSNYERDLTAMYEEQLKDFNTDTKPMMDTIYRDSTSTDITDQAKYDVARYDGRTQGRRQRADSYSMDGTHSAVASARNLNRSHNDAVVKDSIMTQANTNQVAHRMSARNSLLQMSEQLQSTGVASLSSALQSKQQRDAAYQQNKQGLASTLGSIAGAGIGMFAGGPAGASLGASIGGGIGGYVGG